MHSRAANLGKLGMREPEEGSSVRAPGESWKPVVLTDGARGGRREAAEKYNATKPDNYGTSHVPLTSLRTKGTGANYATRAFQEQMHHRRKATGS